MTMMFCLGSPEQAWLDRLDALGAMAGAADLAGLVRTAPTAVADSCLLDYVTAVLSARRQAEAGGS